MMKLRLREIAEAPKATQLRSGMDTEDQNKEEHFL